MVTSRTTVEIMRPPAEVWEYLMDTRHYKLWQSGVMEVKATNGTQLGSILRVKTVNLGKELVLTAEVIENDGRSRYCVRSIQGPITFNSTYTTTPIKGGTRLDIVNQIETHVVFRLAQSVLQSITDSKTKADVLNLKAILEKDEVEV